MSHFAVYALTRDVGIDIVPPAPPVPLPPSRDCSPGIPGAIFLSEFLISRNSYKPVVCYRATESSASRVGMPSAYILATMYSAVQLERRTLKAKDLLFYLRLRRFSQIRFGRIKFVIF